MHNPLSRRFVSDPSSHAQKLWLYGLSLVLALWLGATILLDFVVMPSLADAGMMRSSSFIPAGFSIFHHFNGLELLAGSMLLSGAILLLSQTEISHRIRLGVISSLLFLIPLVYFYYLGPEMAGLGLTSDLSEAIPASMNTMHYAYWGLDVLKMVCVGLYFKEIWPFFDQTAQV